MTGGGVRLERAKPRILAAVRAEVEVGRVGASFREPLDQVWRFLGAHPGLRIQGHNVFLYHHPPAGSTTRMLTVDFGVEGVRSFADEGNVRCLSTPAGEVATIEHRGPYDGIATAHEAIRTWCREHGRTVGPASWEVYGDWADPDRLETTVAYLLAAPTATIGR